MTDHNQWEYCFADPEKGIAVFDNISIEADPLNEARWDQVIPVFEEEQILMCRQIKEKLKPGNLVLDVGTGSGVYAIWAAKQGCKVLGIDINPRAISRATENAIINNIHLYDDVCELENGSICFQVIEFSESFIEEYKNFFDVVICVPGYTPTLTPNVVLFAQAGETGQDCCQKFLKLTPPILKEGGYCFLNHMSLTQKDKEHPTIIYDIKRYFNGKHEIHYARMIENDYNASDLCREIYTQEISKSQLVKDQDDTIEDKIDRILKGYENFALLYIEIQKLTNVNGIVESTLSTVPNKGWDDRIWVHRHCVEYSLGRNTHSPHSLFLDDFSPCTSSNHHDMPSDLKEIENNKFHIYERISNYIDWKLSWEKNKSLFDLILIDSAPMYDDSSKHKRSSNEVKVWMPDNKSQNTMWDILNEYQLIVSSLQKAGFSLILHPYITQICPPKDYWMFSSPSSFSLGNNEATSSIYDKYERKYLDKYLQRIRIVREEIDAKGQNNNDLIIIAEHGYSTSKLNQLSVPVSQDISRFFENDERFFDSGKYIKSQKEKSKSIGQLLQDSEFQSDDYENFYNFLKKDAELITVALHKEINHQFGKILKRDKNLHPCNKYSSKLFVYPLGLKSEFTDSFEELPAAYKGGLWIYARANKWTSKHESFLNDIARITWLFFLDEYSLDYQRLTLKGKKEEEFARLSLLHQFPKDLAALDKKLSEYKQKIDKIRAKNPSIGIPLFTKPDSLGVLLMFTKASHDKLLVELPYDCAQILRGDLNQETIEDFVDRIVWTQAKNRALNYPEVEQKGVIDFGAVELDRKFPKPKLSVNKPFHLDNPIGLYPLFLLALRSAYQHSYKQTLLSDAFVVGMVEISYDENSQLIIYNSGLEPSKEKGKKSYPQPSWERDVKVFKGLTYNWKFHDFGEKDRNDSVESNIRCSEYDYDKKLWKTKIIYTESSIAES